LRGDVSCAIAVAVSGSGNSFGWFRVATMLAVIYCWFRVCSGSGTREGTNAPGGLKFAKWAASNRSPSHLQTIDQPTDVVTRACFNEM
jgi:hypothetical protein